jgi:transmembrane sensor
MRERMKDFPHREHCPDDDADVSRHAAEWFALLLDDGATQTDRANFRTWLEQHPSHADAYAELERLWLGASALPEISSQPSLTRRKIIKSGGALAVLAAAGVGTHAYLQPGADYRTDVGETARFMLPDGSIAELSTDTAISLDFTADRRRALLWKGEAFFTVAADATRPFVVECGGLSSVALGTQFSVARQQDGVRVAVVEHTVRVSASGQIRDVHEGQTVLFSDDRISVPEQVDTGSQLSWRNGKLVFISTRFEDVVATLSKWRRGKMIVMDKALAGRPVSIIVDVRRAGSVLDNLEDGLPIRIASYSPWLTLIYPR